MQMLPPTGLARTGTLAAALDRLTAVGTLWQREGERVRCVACGHRCLLSEGRRGICRVRFVRDGQLRVPFGYVAGAQSDPVEKKPFYHVYPGSDALTFGMLGCDFHCAYCQNWVSSQALRDPSAGAPIRPVSPSELVESGWRDGARLVVSSYNEPLITAEWGVAVFQAAQAAGLTGAVVSNGNATREALEHLRPWIRACKVDLKSYDDRRYRALGGTLARVAEGIRLAREMGLWLEVVTLLVPGFNDSEAELRQIAGFLAALSPDIPWHVTAFHPDYQMTGPPPTTARQLARAAEIGVEAGLRFVYAGNAPGQVGRWENTYCPGCGTKLIDRFGYLVREYHLTAQGTCPKCGVSIPGLWPADPAQVRTGRSAGDFHQRGPRRLL